ncbi:hypothetical protein [Microbulbifer sp. JMSA003]|uniref:hypothetical protein n=1 Tax=unclassified Microbulbifer TaxID=2619833 RepID=UPI0040395A11
MRPQEGASCSDDSFFEKYSDSIELALALRDGKTTRKALHRRWGQFKELGDSKSVGRRLPGREPHPVEVAYDKLGPISWQKDEEAGVDNSKLDARTLPDVISCCGWECDSEKEGELVVDDYLRAARLQKES